MAADLLEESSLLLQLPLCLLHLVLEGLTNEPASLIAAGRSCRCLLTAVSDARLWPTYSYGGALRDELARALGAAALLPPPFLAERLRFSPLSRLTASVSLRGMTRALELTRPRHLQPTRSLKTTGTIAGWRSGCTGLMQAGESPHFTNALAELLSRATCMLVCARPEPAASLIRLHLRPSAVVSCVLQSLPPAPAPAPTPAADPAQLALLLCGGVRGSAEAAARRLAGALLRAPEALRLAAAEEGSCEEAEASEADASLALMIEAQSVALRVSAAGNPSEAAELLRSALLLRTAAEAAASRLLSTPIGAALRGAAGGCASGSTRALCLAAAGVLDRTLARCSRAEQ